MELGTRNQLLDHLFRQHAGRMLATLTRVLGSRNMPLAEEVVQDALVTALQQWPFQGVPDNPSAWLIQVAKNRALDRIRRERSFSDREWDVAAAFESRVATNDPARPFEDDELCMMFMACHPEIAREARVALTLKTVGGFSVPEIARAFLAPEATIAQRLVRVKNEIVSLYDALLDAEPSPVVALNRAIALSRVQGAKAGLHALASLRDDPTLSRYYFFHATLGELSREAGNYIEAARHYEAALALPCSDPARRFLQRKVAAINRQHEALGSGPSAPGGGPGANAARRPP